MAEPQTQQQQQKQRQQESRQLLAQNLVLTEKVTNKVVAGKDTETWMRAAKTADKIRAALPQGWFASPNGAAVVAELEGLSKADLELVKRVFEDRYKITLGEAVSKSFGGFTSFMKGNHQEQIMAILTDDRKDVLVRLQIEQANRGFLGTGLGKNHAEIQRIYRDTDFATITAVEKAFKFQGKSITNDATTQEIIDLYKSAKRGDPDAALIAEAKLMKNALDNKFLGMFSSPDYQAAYAISERIAQYGSSDGQQPVSGAQRFEEVYKRINGSDLRTEIKAVTGGKDAERDVRYIRMDALMKGDRDTADAARFLLATTQGSWFFGKKIGFAESVLEWGTEEGEVKAIFMSRHRATGTDNSIEAVQRKIVQILVDQGQLPPDTQITPESVRAQMAKIFDEEFDTSKKEHILLRKYAVDGGPRSPQDYYEYEKLRYEVAQGGWLAKLVTDTQVQDTARTNFQDFEKMVNAAWNPLKQGYRDGALRALRENPAIAGDAETLEAIRKLFTANSEADSTVLTTKLQQLMQDLKVEPERQTAILNALNSRGNEIALERAQNDPNIIAAVNRFKRAAELTEASATALYEARQQVGDDLKNTAAIGVGLAVAAGAGVFTGGTGTAGVLTVMGAGMGSLAATRVAISYSLEGSNYTATDAATDTARGVADYAAGRVLSIPKGLAAPLSIRTSTIGTLAKRSTAAAGYGATRSVAYSLTDEHLMRNGTMNDLAYAAGVNMATDAATGLALHTAHYPLKEAGKFGYNGLNKAANSKLARKVVDGYHMVRDKIPHGQDFVRTNGEVSKALGGSIRPASVTDNLDEMFNKRNKAIDDLHNSGRIGTNERTRLHTISKNIKKAQTKIQEAEGNLSKLRTELDDINKTRKTSGSADTELTINSTNKQVELEAATRSHTLATKKLEYFYNSLELESQLIDGRNKIRQPIRFIKRKDTLEAELDKALWTERGRLLRSSVVDQKSARKIFDATTADIKTGANIPDSDSTPLPLRMAYEDSRLRSTAKTAAITEGAEETKRLLKLRYDLDASLQRGRISQANHDISRQQLRLQQAANAKYTQGKLDHIDGAPLPGSPTDPLTIDNARLLNDRKVAYATARGEAIAQVANREAQSKLNDAYAIRTKELEEQIAHVKKKKEKKIGIADEHQISKIQGARKDALEKGKKAEEQVLADRKKLDEDLVAQRAAQKFGSTSADGGEARVKKNHEHASRADERGVHKENEKLEKAAHKEEQSLRWRIRKKWPYLPMSPAESNLGKTDILPDGPFYDPRYGKMLRETPLSEALGAPVGKLKDASLGRLAVGTAATAAAVTVSAGAQDSRRNSSFATQQVTTRIRNRQETIIDVEEVAAQYASSSDNSSQQAMQSPPTAGTETVVAATGTAAPSDPNNTAAAAAPQPAAQGAEIAKATVDGKQPSLQPTIPGNADSSGSSASSKGVVEVAEARRDSSSADLNLVSKLNNPPAYIAAVMEKTGGNLEDAANYLPGGEQHTRLQRVAYMLDNVRLVENPFRQEVAENRPAVNFIAPLVEPQELPRREFKAQLFDFQLGLVEGLNRYYASRAHDNPREEAITAARQVLAIRAATDKAKSNIEEA